MRIVFCEDEPIIRKLIGLALRGTPHEFRVAADGGEALDLLRRWRPDVLITDVAMPGMDGRQLAAAVRADAALRDLRIVFMTASVQREDVEAEDAARGHRIAGHLRKPFGPGALRSLLVSLEEGG
jgi:CheY-like chemotaxis protein